MVPGPALLLGCHLQRVLKEQREEHGGARRTVKIVESRAARGTAGTSSESRPSTGAPKAKSVTAQLERFTQEGLEQRFLVLVQDLLGVVHRFSLQVPLLLKKLKIRIILQIVANCPDPVQLVVTEIEKPSARPPWQTGPTPRVGSRSGSGEGVAPT